MWVCGVFTFSIPPPILQPPKRPRRNVSDQSSSSVTPPASSPSPVQKGPRRTSRQRRGKEGGEEERGEEERGEEHSTAGSLYEAVKSGRSALAVRESGRVGEREKENKERNKNVEIGEVEEGGEKRRWK